MNCRSGNTVAHLDVTEMQADADLNAPLRCGRGVVLDQRLLNLEGAPCRFECASELDQEAVANALDLAPAVFAKDGPQQALMFFDSSSGNASLRCVKAL